MYSQEDEYESDNDEVDENCQQQRRKLTKNEQIYGDFYEAYEEEKEVLSSESKKQSEILKNQFSSEALFSSNNTYARFKSGAALETYSSEVQVDIPINSKCKVKTPEVQADKPTVGQFSLFTFLDQLSKNSNKMEEIQQENQDQQSVTPVGLNSHILQRLQLVKIEQDIDQQQIDLEKMDYHNYIGKGRGKPKQKYRTEEEKQLARQFGEGYGIGFKMLQKMGYKVTKGLGKDETGLQRPVQAVFKTAFTCKDERSGEESQKQQQQQPQLSIAQKLFQYKSKDAAVNNMLEKLKARHEKLQAQIYYTTKEIQSFEREQEIQVSLQAQKSNEISSLSEEIGKLHIIEEDLSKCEQYPHLALTYRIDHLFVKQAYEQLVHLSVKELLRVAVRELDKFNYNLNCFYLAKQKQTLKRYSVVTSVKTPLNLKFNKQNSVFIDLTSENDIVMVSEEDQRQITQFLSVLINQTILPKIANYFCSKTTIKQCDDIRMIDMIEAIKKYDPESVSLISKQYVNPLCRNYLSTVSLQSLQYTGQKAILPHFILFPWLTIISPAELNLLAFYRRIASQIWSITSNVLHNILSPLLKFSNQQERQFIVDQYLAPMILNQMEQFTLSSTNKNMIAGFISYSTFLQREINEQIIKETVIPEIVAAYRDYKTSASEAEMAKWLARWRKQIDKVAYGCFEKEMKEFGIIV